MKKILKVFKNQYVYLGLLLAGMILCMVLFVTSYFRQMSAIHAQNSEGENKSFYEHHYALIAEDGSEEFWSAVYQGAQEEGSAQDAYVELTGSNLSMSYDAVQLMNIAIAEKVDGILLEYDGSEELDGKIAEASEAGIPVVTLLRDSPSNTRISYIGISYYNLGQQYAQQIIDVIRDEEETAGNDSDGGQSKKETYDVMILMNKDIPDSARTIIYSSIQETLGEESADIPNVVPETRTVDEEGSFEAEEEIRNIFLKEQNMPDIIVCLDETCSVCVYQALVDYNQVGNIELIAYYTGSSILSGIDKKIIHSTVAVDTKLIGSHAVDALTEYLQTGYASEYYSVDPYVIDSSNVADYE